MTAQSPNLSIFLSGELFHLKSGLNQNRGRYHLQMLFANAIVRIEFIPTHPLKITSKTRNNRQCVSRRIR